MFTRKVCEFISDRCTRLVIISLENLSDGIPLMQRILCLRQGWQTFYLLIKSVEKTHIAFFSHVEQIFEMNVNIENIVFVCHVEVSTEAIVTDNKWKTR